MSKKSKLLIENSIDPVTSRLREAIYSNEIKSSSNLASPSAQNLNEENKRKKRRRKSTPNITVNTSAYLDSENDEDYINFYDEEACLETSQNHTEFPSSNSVTNVGKFEQDTDEDLFDERRKWNLDEKINISNKYNSEFVKFLDAKKFDFRYIQENGFESPFVFIDKSGLGMRVPSENFRVSDVKSCVGSKRIIDVVDVNTQKGLNMSMKDWCEYYENPNRDRLLNVISLEFSHTKLENYVEAPLVVRQMDWIETAWPLHLREAHTESTNLIEKMMYPKVQKYVLMSVSGCYTDFHIDMGGTSVWYHVLKGEKIFWLIPPTDKNLKIYEKWILSGNQSNVFLPDLVEDCQRIVLKQGWTFMLPSGWIHGVYTTRDSLVFGGNFLHSFNVSMQLKVNQIESKTKVPQQYRYPFFFEMMWFVMERYVHCLTGVTHMDDLSDANAVDTENRKAYKTFQPSQKLIITKHEYQGLRALYDFLTALPESKRQKPKQIVQSILLLQTFKKLLDDYAKAFELNEDGSGEATGTPFMHWPKPEKKYLKQRELDDYNSQGDLQEQSQNSINDFAQDLNEFSNRSLVDSVQFSELFPGLNILSSNLNQQNEANAQTRRHVMRNMPRTKGSIKKRLRPQNVPRSNVERRRRVRCHMCEPCTRDDCGDCKYCKDMKKFGGTGVSKQCCLAKQCLQPLLPTTTTCMLCEVLIDRFSTNKANIMYECEICFEIYHVQCFRKQYNHINDIEPIINEDLSNCWKCPNCVNKGYIKPEIFKQESKTNGHSESNSESASLNNSFNSTITSVISSSLNLNTDFFLSPSSKNNNTLNNIIQPKPKQKRHRRTKQEIENSRKSNSFFNFIKSNQNTDNLRSDSKKLKHQNKEDDSLITIDSLTYFEKQIILREFCEICYDEPEITPPPVKIKINKRNSNKFYVSNSWNSSDQDTILVDEESSTISVNNNDSTSTQNSYSETVQTDEYNLESDLIDSNNEHIYYDDDNEDDLNTCARNQINA